MSPKTSPKMLTKLGNFEFCFRDISVRSNLILKLFGPVFTLLCQGQCFLFSSPNLQRLARCDFKSLIRFLAGPAPRFRTYTDSNNRQRVHALSRR